LHTPLKVSLYSQPDRPPRQQVKKGQKKKGWGEKKDNHNYAKKKQLVRVRRDWD